MIKMIKNDIKKTSITTICSWVVHLLLAGPWGGVFALRDPAFLCLDIYREEALGVCLYYRLNTADEWYKKNGTKMKTEHSKSVIQKKRKKEEERRRDNKCDDDDDDDDDAQLIWEETPTRHHHHLFFVTHRRATRKCDDEEDIGGKTKSARRDARRLFSDVVRRPS